MNPPSDCAILIAECRGYGVVSSTGIDQVLNTETLSPEQEMVQDLLAIVDCFSARLYGLRNHRKTLKKALSDAARSQNPAKPNA